MAKRLTSSVTVYTNGQSELQGEIDVAVNQDPVIKSDNRIVTRLEKVADDSSQVIVHLDDGTHVTHGFVVRGQSQNPD
jgi:hypothetical protein